MDFGTFIVGRPKPTAVVQFENLCRFQNGMRIVLESEQDNPATDSIGGSYVRCTVTLRNGSNFNIPPTQDKSTMNVFLLGSKRN
jgi:hypothetical protein